MENLQKTPKHPDIFTGDFSQRTYPELMQIKQKSGGTMVLATYDYLRVCRTMDLTGRFTEGGYETFKDWLSNETFFSMSAYQRDLRIAYEYEENIVRMIGFPSLEAISQMKIPEKPKKLLVEKLKQEIEIKGKVPSKEKVREMASKIAIKKEKVEKGGEVNVLRTRLREAKKTIKAQNEKIRKLEEKVLHQEVTIEDQKRYINELQQGERVV